MTKVLHVITGLGMGGAERNLVQVACALQQRGMDQHVACVRSSGVWADALIGQGIPVTELEVDGMPAAPRGLYRLVSLMRTLRPTNIQGWMYHGDLFAALAHRLLPGKRRLLWNLRASNTDQGGYSQILRLNGALSRWPDVVIANSKSGLDFHAAKGYRARRTEIIPNGIDIEKNRPDAEARALVRKDLGLPADGPVVIHVARVDPMKDHGNFLKAMAAVPQLSGIMIGAGTENLTCPPNVRALGVRRDVERYYAASDIVISTSAYAEGFSNVIAEGMSAGLYPIATDIGDARAIVGNIGSVVQPRDFSAIVAELTRAAAMTAEERSERGLLARKHIVDRFTLAAATDRYQKIYAEFEG